MAKSFPNTGATVIDSVADLPAASAALEGLMVFQKDSNELKICDGSSWVSVVDTDTPPALELIATNTFSAATSTSFQNKFSTIYDNYRIIFTTTATSAGQPNLNLQFLDSNNVARTTSYYMGGYKVTQAGGGSVDNQSNSTACFVGYLGSDVGTLCIDIYNPYINSSSTITCLWTANGSSAVYGGYMGGGRFSWASEAGAILSVSSGTMTGKARLYGYRNSI